MGAEIICTPTFKISKDVLEMKIPDGDHKKRRYQVVAVKPIDHSDSTEVGSSRMKYEKPQRLARKGGSWKKCLPTNPTDTGRFPQRYENV